MTFSSYGTSGQIIAERKVDVSITSAYVTKMYRNERWLMIGGRWGGGGSTTTSREGGRVREPSQTKSKALKIMKERLKAPVMMLVTRERLAGYNCVGQAKRNEAKRSEERVSE